MGGKLAIYIPAYNEERSIGSVVLQAKRYGRVIVVDDGSTDKTAQIATLAGARVVAREKNGGYGAALQTILDEARAAPEAAFVIMDGDYQHNPSDIPKISKPVLEGKADVAVGSRFKGGFVGQPAYRKEGIAILNRMASAGNGKTGVDFQCGFRALSKKAAGKIRITEDGFAGGAEMLTSATEAGLRLAAVPISVRYYGESKQGALEHGAGLFAYFAGSIAYRKPLFLFGLAGAALLFCAALLGIYVVQTFYSTKILPIGSALLTVFCGVGGMVLMLMGINLYTLNAILKKKGNDG